MSPAQVRAILAELRDLCMSPCTMTHADRLAHWQAVAAVRVCDAARRNGGPQMMLVGV